MHAKDAFKMIGTNIYEGTYLFEKVECFAVSQTYMPLKSLSGLSLR